MTRLEWTDPAITDLDNIQDYIAGESTEYANAMVERFILAVECLISFPEGGRHIGRELASTFLPFDI
ncbi:MAG: type II toxin-antitoxin system RelE/ParE family toxin, partial [Gammaproteobacteria bacterium]